jgi:uncharacterized membrane protein
MNNKGSTVVELVICLVVVILAPVVAYGWVENIIKLYHSTFNTITGQLICRIVGVVLAPLGVVVGYL